jgi:hypothetical protein
MKHAAWRLFHHGQKNLPDCLFFAASWDMISPSTQARLQVAPKATIKANTTRFRGPPH